MGSWLVRSSPNQVVHVQALAGNTVSCSWTSATASLHPGVIMGTGKFNAGGDPGGKRYSYSLYATEIRISSGQMGHLARIQT